MSKWVCVGTVALIGGVMIGTKDSDDDWGRVIIPVLPMAITTTSLFAVDIADIGNVPSELSDFH